MQKIFFKKTRILYGVIFFTFQCAVSIWFIHSPEIFIRNFLMREIHVQIVGVLMLVYGFFMFLIGKKTFGGRLFLMIFRFLVVLEVLKMHNVLKR